MPPTYRDLARSSTTLERTVHAEELGRLAELGALSGPVLAVYAFFVLEGKPAVRAEARATVALPCQWCEQAVSREVQLSCEVLLAEHEAQASDWSAEGDTLPVVVVAGTEFDAAALIEDELILALPGRVCTDSDCPRRPAASYGKAVQDTPGPLAGLRQLLDAKQREE